MTQSPPKLTATLPPKPAGRLAVLGLGMLVFFSLAALTSSAAYLIAIKAGSERPYTIFLTWHLSQWLPWAVLVPLVFSLVARFRFSRARWLLALAIHIPASFMWLPLYAMLIQLGQIAGGTASMARFAQEYGNYLSVGRLYDYYWYWIILMAAHAWFFFQDSLQQKRATAELGIRNLALEKSLAESRLNELRAQLQPHFLYNAHNTIAALIREERGQDALMVLNRLSALLRGSLAQDPRQTVPLTEELELLDHYLSIQKLRFPTRLKVHIQVEKVCEKAYIPPMILQPLAENAVHHGALSETEGDSLNLEVQQKGAQLELRLINTTHPEGSDHQGFGIGLRNTRERLAQLYGQEWSLELEQLAGARMAVHLTLPFREQP